MTILKLHSFCTVSKSQKLMAKTDTKNWCSSFQKLFDFSDDSNVFCRISRSVTKHDSIRIQCHNLICCICRRNCNYFKTALQKLTADISFGTKVPEHNLFAFTVFHCFIRIVDFCPVCSYRNKTIFSAFTKNYISRFFNPSSTASYRSNCIHNFIFFYFFKKSSFFLFVIQSGKCFNSFF